jgi:DNA-binding CsgD family transcriptional regulator
MSAGRKEQKQERVARAFELRKAGKTYRQIAEMLDYSHEQVRKDISTILQSIAAETKASAVDLLSIELARLDDLQFGIWADARRGDKRAIDSVLRIMERRARLLGLDITRNLTVSITPDEIVKMNDEELHELVSSISKNISAG